MPDDIVEGLVLADVMAGAADHERGLAFPVHRIGRSLRQHDRLAVADDGIRVLEKARRKQGGGGTSASAPARIISSSYDRYDRPVENTIRGRGISARNGVCAAGVRARLSRRRSFTGSLASSMVLTKRSTMARASGPPSRMASNGVGDPICQRRLPQMLDRRQIEDLGLNRTTRRVRLTEIGRSYYERCEQILHDLEEAD